MLVHLISDIHLEFGDFPAPGPKALSADLHLLAGDIGVGPQGLVWALQNLQSPTAYVFGNHEHYGNKPMDHTMSKAREMCAGTNVSPLECNELLLIPGARVLGATLWTDFKLFDDPKRDRESIENANLRMSDYRKICFGFEHGHDEFGRALPIPIEKIAEGYDVSQNKNALTPAVTVELHKRTLVWLSAKLNEPFSGKTIVLSHHAPHPKSLLYEEPSALLDAAYASDLTDLILKHGNVDLWAHGHTHVPCDYRIGKTRIVSNPRGYSPSALVDGFDPDFLVEI